MPKCPTVIISFLTALRISCIFHGAAAAETPPGKAVPAAVADSPVILDGNPPFKVHELLIAAALATENILEKPAPFVFQARTIFRLIPST